MRAATHRAAGIHVCSVAAHDAYARPTVQHGMRLRCSQPVPGTARATSGLVLFPPVCFGKLHAHGNGHAHERLGAPSFGCVANVSCKGRTPRAGLNSRAGGCNIPSLGCAAACHAETAKPHARRPSRRSWHRMRPIRRDVQEPARNLTRATHDRLVASAMQAQSRCAQQQPPNGARKAPHKGQATRAARAGGKLDPEHCTARMIPTSAESHLGGGVG
jgi:hypothetical protein